MLIQRLIWLIGLTAVTDCCPLAGAQERPPGGQKAAIEWVRELGSDNYQRREAATVALRNRDEVWPDLRTALPGMNAEAARRAKALLEEMAARRMRACLEYGRRGRIDLLVEAANFVEGQPPSTDMWQAVIDAGWELLKRAEPDSAKRGAWERRGFPKSSYTEYVKLRPALVREPAALKAGQPPEYLTLTSRTALRAKSLYCSLVASAGEVRIGSQIASSIVFVNADVVAADCPHYSVIVADGNVRGGFLRPSVVIARGDVAMEQASSNFPAVVRAGRKAQIDEFHNLGGSVSSPTAAQLVGVDVRERDPHPLSLVRFFETADIGLEVVTGAGGVNIKNLRADAPPAKAGVKIGDVIEAVEGIKVADPEALRRHLRRGFIAGGVMLSVRRGYRIGEVAISFAGWELPR